MEYSKPALTFEEQADRLLSRGLIADRDTLISRLKVVNYYRLSGYLYPFRRKDDSYADGTTLEKVWRRYTFDRRLRLLVLDAIERVEVAAKTQIVYVLAHETGPFGYTKQTNLPKLDTQQFAYFLQRIFEETKHSREDYVLHFKKKYGAQNTYLPLWMLAEIMSFGELLTLFMGVETAIKQKIAAQYGVADVVLFSWLRSLNVTRNICAHHGRLWNRELGVRPMIPGERKHPQWYTPVIVRNNRIFGTLTVLKFMLGFCAPQSGWPHRVSELLSIYPDVPITAMGFPPDWTKCPIWE